MANVTLKDVYDAINSLEEKIDKRLNDHENRIRSNESFRWKIVGGLGILSFIAAYIWDIILN